MQDWSREGIRVTETGAVQLAIGLPIQMPEEIIQRVRKLFAGDKLEKGSFVRSSRNHLVVLTFKDTEAKQDALQRLRKAAKSFERAEMKSTECRYIIPGITESLDLDNRRYSNMAPSGSRIAMSPPLNKLFIRLRRLDGIDRIKASDGRNSAITVMGKPDWPAVDGEILLYLLARELG